MTVAKGTSLGPYEIVSRIGAGGMGEVWRARDKRIGRDVAVKVLPEYAGGEEQVRRFEQEARAAGALNHPGLLTIFDVGRDHDSPYIVMELLEGETLRDAIGDGNPRPLPLRKTIDYGIQIASALAVAHEKGIIHRDLKPENIYVTAEDRVKILDFGLAKLAPESLTGEQHSTGRHLTSTGMVVGTPGYMSPEQVRAHPIDHRTDIFALGSILYEMVSGRRAFDKESAVETMTAVLNVEPEPLPLIVPDTPAALDAIVRHCMEKNPRDRFQSARDLAFQLRLLTQVSGTLTRNPLLDPVRPKRRPWLRIGVAAVALLALAGAGYALLRQRGEPAPQTMVKYKQLTFGDGLTTEPTMAPDGKVVAYSSARNGNRDIYVQRVDGHVPTNITADSPADDSEPAFSPDGSQIAFRSERDGGGIFVMTITGESPRRLTHFGHHPAWSPDGKRLAVSTQPVAMRPHYHPLASELWVVDAQTGQTTPLLRAQDKRESDASQPSWSPNGRRIAYWGVSATDGQRQIWTIDPDAANPQLTIVRVTKDPAVHWNPVWSPDGKYIYFGSDRSGAMNLWRVAMDQETGTAAGEPEPMTVPAPVSGNFTFSQQGKLAYGTVIRTFRLMAIPVDKTTGALGAPRPLFGGSMEPMYFDPSPDQQSIALSTGGGQEDVFIVNADGTRLRQLTNDLARDRGVTWSADGKTLYLYSDRKGSYNIWSIRADGSGLAPVTDDTTLRRIGVRTIYMPNASAGGRILATSSPNGVALLYLDRPMAQRLEPIALESGDPRWSPDGTRLAGMLGGGIGVYSTKTRRTEKVTSRGDQPQWLDDDSILFFEDSGPAIVDVESRRVRTVTAPDLPGVDWSNPETPRRLSHDGSTLYVRQTLEQGDIWLADFTARR